MKIYKKFDLWWNSLNIKDSSVVNKSSARAAWDVQQMKIEKYKSHIKSITHKMEELIKQLEYTKKLLKEIRKDV